MAITPENPTGIGPVTWTVTDEHDMSLLQTRMEQYETASSNNNFTFLGAPETRSIPGSTTYGLMIFDAPTVTGTVPNSGTLQLFRSGVQVDYSYTNLQQSLIGTTPRFAFTVGTGATDWDNGDIADFGINVNTSLVTTVGPKAYLTLREGDRLIINGTLNHNTEEFTLVDENILTNSNDPAPIYVTSTGTWNFGIIENNGLIGQGNTYTTSVGYIAANQSTEVRATLFARTPGVGGMINARGTINFNGGDMEGFVQIGVDGGSLISNAPSKLIIGDLDPPQTAFNGYVQRFATWDAGTDTTVDISDVNIFGGIVNIGRRAFGTPIEANRQRGDIGYLWQHIDNILPSTSAPGVDYPVFRNIDFRNNLVDAACYSETSGISGAKLQNIAQGTDIYYTCGRTDVGNRNSGFTWWTKELDINLINSSGTNQQGTFWIRDTNNPIGNTSAKETLNIGFTQPGPSASDDSSSIVNDPAYNVPFNSISRPNQHTLRFAQGTNGGDIGENGTSILTINARTATNASIQDKIASWISSWNTLENDPNFNFNYTLTIDPNDDTHMILERKANAHYGADDASLLTGDYAITEATNFDDTETVFTAGDRASLTEGGVIGRQGPTNSAGVSYSAFNNNSDITYRGLIHPTNPFVYTVDTTTKLGELTQTAFNTDGTVEVVLGASDINPNATGASSFTRSDRQTGIWRLDLRGKTPFYGDDLFDIDIWSYENTKTDTLEMNLSGAGAFGLRQELAPDSNITKNRAEVTTLSTAMGASYVSTTSGVTFNHAGLTFDDLYDVPKFKKETVAAEIERPNAANLFCTSNGEVVDFGDNTLTLSSTNKVSIGTKHTGIKQNTSLDLATINVVDGMSIEAPLLNNVGPELVQLGTAKLIGATSVIAVNANTSWNVALADVSDLTLNVNVADGIVLRIFTQSLDASSFTAVNNTGSGTIEFFDFPLTIMTASIPADVPDCWYHVSTPTAVSAFNNAEGFHTFGTATNLFGDVTTVQNDKNNPTTFELRLLGKNKYDGSGTEANTNYMHSLAYVEFDNNGELGMGANGFNLDANVIINSRFNDALTRQAEVVDTTEAPYSGYTATLTIGGGFASGVAGAIITVEGVHTQNQITSAQTLRLLMDAFQAETGDNKSRYLTLASANHLEDDDIIYPGTNETIINADKVRLTTSSSRQFLTSVATVGTGSGIEDKNLDNVPTITIQLPAVAPLDIVATAVDQSNTSNGVGYLVGTNTDLGPARDDKVDGTNYRGNN